MPLAIATNNASLYAAASASRVNRVVETSMNRLSSGKRINSASDDAAGVAIGSRLSSEIRGTDQAIRNSLDGQALIDTAEAAHSEVENILQRMREIGVQAANDTNHVQDRANLQAEMDGMSTEIDRIAGSTTWAGAELMEASAGTSFSFQVGTATGDKYQINITINAMSAKALGVGDIDIKYTVDPSVTTPLPFGSEFLINTTKEGRQNDPSATGLADGGFVATWTGPPPGDGLGVFGQRYDASGVAFGSELLINNTTSGEQYNPSVTALADGGFVATWAVSAGQRFDASGVASGSEFQVNTSAPRLQLEPSVTALCDGSFVVTWAGNVANGSGKDIFLQRYDASGVASGSKFQVNTSTNGQHPSVTTLADGGFLATWQGTYGQGEHDIVGQRFDVGITGEPTGFQVTNAASSRASITSIDAAIQTVNIQRSELGAVSNRLNHTVNNLTNISANLSAAKGSIEDADFALEATNLAKNQILQQDSTAMLAQANESKQNVLSLLQG